MFGNVFLSVNNYKENKKYKTQDRGDFQGKGKWCDQGEIQRGIPRYWTVFDLKLCDEYKGVCSVDICLMLERERQRSNT